MTAKPSRLPDDMTRQPAGGRPLRGLLLWTIVLLLGLPLAGCLGKPAEEPEAIASPAAMEGAVEDQAPDEGEGEPDDAAVDAEDAEAAEHVETDLILDARQLIFEGKRSGEGYFSADGRKLIYQAEREADNPFYQIYLLDLETGDNELVSTGVGKTTCAWVHPEGDKVLFAATHEDPEAEAKMAEEFRLREEATGRRYEWNYDDTYEIYEKDLETGELTNLTNAVGYDAEGSWSPDGSKIAFASNRLAYSEPMSAEDQERFDFDNGYMADIYIMDADGSNVERLTEEPGYDGGPFFSPDGSRIVYRHFNETGELAEIWTMAIDGTDKRQITRLDAMSWAPFYHPSGDYIIFTTNLHGFQNFEFYMVDVEGQKEPIRVTFTEGADVLPVFSPDGQQLTWSSTRGEGSGSQQWIAGWDHDKALELLELAPAQGSVSYQGGEGDLATADMAATEDEITAEDARLHVEVLAGEAMDGRLTGTPGEAAATEYVAEAFEALGLQPAGSEGYYQPFEFTSGVSMQGPNVLSITLGDGTELEPEVDVDWRPLAFSKPASAGFADLVFAGYGINAPEEGEQAAYDSYGDLDVEGKWVVVLRYLPENVTPERRQHLSRYASLRFKAMEARDRGAAGILVVSGPNSQVQEQLVPLAFDASVSGTAIHAASISDDLAGQIFEAAGQDLASAQSALDDGEIEEGEGQFELGGAQAGAHFTLAFETSTGRNAIGRLQIGDAPSEEVVVLGAHVDHLGRGQGGDSLARAGEEDQIHFGADDNASGVAGLIEIAQQMAARETAGELPEEARDLVFAAWSGEELGLLGSNHYVKTMKQEMGDAETLYPAVAAYLNMDMIGRLEEQLVLQGVGSSSYWRGEIERRNVPIGLPLSLSDDSYLPTDATSFYLAGVPILSAFTGAHEDYHSPRDTADKLDYVDLAKTARLMGLIAQGLSTAEAAPDYVAIAPSSDSENRRVGRVFLGTIPDYAGSEVEGMLLSGVSAEGPAEEAGIQGGDIIVEMAGESIANIYDYTRVLDSLKIGEEASVVVMRDGERLELSIVPTSRD